jgi:hypothetical protein
MDALDATSHHAPVRVLPHIRKLDDALGDVLVRATCPWGASWHIEPEVLARIRREVRDARSPGDSDALLAVREEGRRGVAVAKPRPRGGVRR